MSTDGNGSGSEWPQPADDYAYILTLSDAELAWEFLRRNPDYRKSYQANQTVPFRPREHSTGTRVWQIDEQEEQARAWGLTNFRRSRASRA